MIILKDVFLGILELLKDLWVNNVKILLVFVSKNGFFLFVKMGLESYFDVIVDLVKVVNGKFVLDIFLFVVKEIGLIFCDCIGIEDVKVGIVVIIVSGV